MTRPARTAIRRATALALGTAITTALLPATAASAAGWLSYATDTPADVTSQCLMLGADNNSAGQFCDGTVVASRPSSTS
ncbi:MAG: hypothetical protein EAS51_03445 [Microbacteriaceae bacterium]|nr:MAG: hypothetical protein EAS51_03445 [Microbacteriaceae bacterium]